MKTNQHTDEIIEKMTSAHCGAQASQRERHLYREALRSLVRLAKAEQMLEMKSDVQLLMAAPADMIWH